MLLAAPIAADLAAGALAEGAALELPFLRSLASVLGPEVAEGEVVQHTEITIPVQSSCIRSIGYHVGDVITVVFIRGGVYQYSGTEDMFMAVALAPSKGAWFNEHLR